MLQPGHMDPGLSGASGNRGHNDRDDQGVGGAALCIRTDTEQRPLTGDLREFTGDTRKGSPVCRLHICFEMGEELTRTNEK